MSPGYGALRGYMLAPAMQRKMLAKINDDFGDRVSCAVNVTGSMRSQTYVDWFLPDVVDKSVKKLRSLARKQKRDGEVVMIEDEAKGHTGSPGGQGR